MDVNTQIEDAILLLGHKPDSAGNIQKGVRIRADLAARLSRERAGLVIIPSGWYWPKDERLKAFCEAYIMERYLREVHGDDMNIVCEPYSTSVQENILFTRVLFPNLRQVTIVAGQLFESRVLFVAEKTFGSAVRIEIETCNDGLSDIQNEERLLANFRCILENMTPDDILQLMLGPDGDGNLRSEWPALYEAHGRNCSRHA